MRRTVVFPSPRLAMTIAAYVAAPALSVFPIGHLGHARDLHVQPRTSDEEPHEWRKDEAKKPEKRTIAQRYVPCLSPWLSSVSS
jgi:hypothetical protein